MSFSEPQHIALDAVHASPQPTALLRVGWSGGPNSVPGPVRGERFATGDGCGIEGAPGSRSLEGVRGRFQATLHPREYMGSGPPLRVA